MLASPKCPTLKVIDHTTAEATTKAAAAAKTGRQRTATHSRTGKTRARGNAVDQGPCGNAITNALNTANIKRPTEPSNTSRRDGISRTASAIPTSSGATVTMPSRQEPNQTRHTMEVESID